MTCPLCAGQALNSMMIYIQDGDWVISHFYFDVKPALAKFNAATGEKVSVMESSWIMTALGDYIPTSLSYDVSNKNIFISAISIKASTHERVFTLVDSSTLVVKKSLTWQFTDQNVIARM